MQPLIKDTLIQINATMCDNERSLEVLQRDIESILIAMNFWVFLYVLSGKIHFFSISSNAHHFTISGKESCIIATSCIFSNIQADVVLEFMKDSSVFILPNKSFEALTHSNESIMRFNLSL